MSDKKPVNARAPEVCPPWCCFTFDNFQKACAEPQPHSETLYQTGLDCS